MCLVGTGELSELNEISELSELRSYLQNKKALAQASPVSARLLLCTVQLVSRSQLLMSPQEAQCIQSRHATDTASFALGTRSRFGSNAKLPLWLA